MGDPGMGKMLLMVACALGVLQGLLTLIGGCIAVFDKAKGVGYWDAFVNDRRSIDPNADPNEADQEPQTQDRLLIGLKEIDSPDVRNEKYHCGAMGIKLKSGYNPDIINNKRDKTKGKDVYEKMDRGWYRRVHDYCRKNEHQGVQTNKDWKICKLKGYGYVLSFAITCGLGWIIGGVVAMLASVTNMQLLGFAAAGIFAVVYIVFLCLFSIGWHSARQFSLRCFTEFCRAIRWHGKRSCHEFLAYSICGVVLILAAIGLSAFGALQLSPDDGQSAKYDSKPADPKPVDPKPEEPPLNNQGTLPPPPSQPANPEEKPVKAAKPDPIAPTDAGKDYIKKFVQLNRYITDKEKMENYANKKFDATDTDHSGTITSDEFQKFVNQIMGKKGVPPPKFEKVQAMMKRYDTDSNKILDKNEFQQMLLEIFIESREILISKYAVEKANSWKPEKVPSYKNLDKAEDLDKLLNDTEKFYKKLSEIAKRVDKDKNAMLDINEVTDLIKTFCNEYNTPVLAQNDIIEVMGDMGRSVKDYDTPYIIIDTVTLP